MRPLCEYGWLVLTWGQTKLPGEWAFPLWVCYSLASCTGELTQVWTTITLMYGPLMAMARLAIICDKNHKRTTRMSNSSIQRRIAEGEGFIHADLLERLRRVRVRPASKGSSAPSSCGTREHLRCRKLRSHDRGRLFGNVASGPVQQDCCLRQGREGEAHRQEEDQDGVD